MEPTDQQTEPEVQIAPEHLVQALDGAIQEAHTKILELTRKNIVLSGWVQQSNTKIADLEKALAEFVQPVPGAAAEPTP